MHTVGITLKMKLNEILIKNKIVKYESSASVGKRYVVLDESTGRIKSLHPTKEVAYRHIKTKTFVTEKTKILSEAISFSFDGRNFPVGSIFQLNAEGTKWGVGLGNADEIVEFEGRKARAAAQSLVNNLPAGQQRWTASTLKNAAGRLSSNRNASVNIKQIDLTRFNRRAVINTFANLENIKDSNKFVGPTLAKILNSNFWRGFSRIVGAVGIPVAVVWTNIGIINDLEEEANNDPSKAEENYELRNIIIAQTSAQILFFLRYVLRTTSLFNRALSAIKWTVRSVQGGAALTVAGSIPSALSFLVTEAGWLIAAWIISSEAVQTALAEWIHDSMFSGIFQMAGQGVSLAATFLDNAFDGRFGTAELRNSMRWESGDPEQVEGGEFSSTSEWAKLVFHGLLFPPGREKQLVPYIRPEQRATLLRQKLGIAEEPVAGGRGDGAAEVARRNADAAQTATSEPGMPVNPDARTGPQ